MVVVLHDAEEPADLLDRGREPLVLPNEERREVRAGGLQVALECEDETSDLAPEVLEGHGVEIDQPDAEVVEPFDRRVDRIGRGMGRAARAREHPVEQSACPRRA